MSKDKRRILYIDDDDLMTGLMEIQLAEYDISMHAAHNMEDGIAAYESDKYSLVLIDWNLIKAKGSEVAKEIRAINPDAKIAFLSGLYSDENMKIAKSFNPEACLQKDEDIPAQVAAIMEKLSK